MCAVLYLLDIKAQENTYISDLKPVHKLRAATTHQGATLFIPSDAGWWLGTHFTRQEGCYSFQDGDVDLSSCDPWWF